MNRRSFFSSLGALAATAVIDPEKLLWQPGKKLISIPAPARLLPYQRAIIAAIQELNQRPFDLLSAKLALWHNWVPGYTFYRDVRFFDGLVEVWPTPPPHLRRAVVDGFLEMKKQLDLPGALIIAGPIDPAPEALA